VGESKKNADILLEWLSDLKSNPIAEKISHQINTDQVDFPKAVAEELNEIENGFLAGKEFEIVIFTNQLAQQKKYKRSLNKKIEEETLEVPKQEHFITEAQPLNTPEMLEQALSIVEKVYPPKTHTYILITKSHGSKTKVITPRLTADHRNIERDKIELYLDDHPSDSRPELKIKTDFGVTKERYIDLISSKKRMFFDLVYIDSCESIRGLTELPQLPANVRLLYAPDHPIKYRTLDYSAVFDRYANGMSLVESISKELDEKIGMGRPKKYLSNSPSNRYLYFLPLLLCFAFAVYKGVRLIQRRNSQKARYNG